MPIYAYKCSACGHARDVLQKMSDPVLTGCPACGGETFVKQVTAAGFQLKGSGWYATDFKGGAAPSASVDKGGDTPAPASVEGAAAAPAGQVAAPTTAAAPATPSTGAAGAA